MSNTALSTLVTPRLVLNALKPTDAPALFAILSDPEVTRYLDSDTLEDVSKAEEMLEMFAERFAEGSELRWAMRLLDGGTLIGTCNLYDPYATRRRSEFGTVLGRHWWRKGYAVEALRSVLDYGFRELQLNRIESLVYTENEASRSMLEKVGFKMEGVMRQHAWEKGRYWDDCMYALLAEEYSAT